jgi:Phage integrase, N-terminal SAM-like domain
MTRRADGESSVHKGADGRWHGFISMGTKAGGKRDRRHVAGRTRAAVVAQIRELERRRDAGVTAASSGTLTVAAWLDLWLDGAAAARVRPRTLESYRQTVVAHIVPTIGHVRLARLQPEHVEQLHRAMLDKGLSPATALRAHRVLARALRVAEQRGRVGRNVCALVDAPSAGRPSSGGALSPDGRARCSAPLKAAATEHAGPLRSVADMLGHSQTRVTEDTYQHVLPALAQDAADRMGVALWQQ